MNDLSHQTLLMEFHVDPKDFSSATNEGTWFLVLHANRLFYWFYRVLWCFQFPGHTASVLKVVEKHLGQSTEVYRRHDVEMFTIIHETSSESQTGRSLITIRIKSSGLVLINVDLTAEDGASFDTPKCRLFEKEVRDSLNPIKGKALCPIRRGGSNDLFRYLTSSGIHSYEIFFL